jgi:hypothetical protein
MTREEIFAHGFHGVGELVEWRETATSLAPYDPQGRKLFWAAQPGSQAAFLECPLEEVLYEGTRGPGKTDAMLMDFCRDLGKWGEDWKGIIFRKTFPELQDVIDKSRRWIPEVFPGASFNEAKSFWQWPGGEKLIFRPFEKSTDYWTYHGHAYPWIGWEELTLYPSGECYKSMFSCSRSTRVGMPRRVRSTANPYGVGHNWVKEYWGLPVPPNAQNGVGRVLGGKDGEPWRVAIHGKLTENKILLKAQPNYVANLRKAARNPSELAAWIDGSWDIVAGGMLDDVWMRVRDRCVVAPFQVPPNWRIDRAFDWGSAKPSAVGWFAESDGSDYTDANGKTRSSVRGDTFMVDELYTWNGTANEGSRQLASEIGKAIVVQELERGWRSHMGCIVKAGPADRSIFDEENGMCVYDDLSAKVLVGAKWHPGPRFTEADKGPGSRKQGWQMLRRFLSGCLPDEGQKIRERPGLFIFETCHHWLRTVPVLPRDNKDLDDVDTQAEDHMGDMTRYRLRAGSRAAQGRMLNA